MVEKITPLEAALSLAEKLSSGDKVRLIERLVAAVERDIVAKPGEPVNPLYGLWADLDLSISGDDLAEARRDMWASFPRENI
jgi:hypothetical protein